MVSFLFDFICTSYLELLSHIYIVPFLIGVMVVESSLILYRLTAVISWRTNLNIFKVVVEMKLTDSVRSDSTSFKKVYGKTSRFKRTWRSKFFHQLATTRNSILHGGDLKINFFRKFKKVYFHNSGQPHQHKKQ